MQDDAEYPQIRVSVGGKRQLLPAKHWAIALSKGVIAEDSEIEVWTSPHERHSQRADQFEPLRRLFEARDVGRQTDEPPADKAARPAAQAPAPPPAPPSQDLPARLILFGLQLEKAHEAIASLRTEWADLLGEVMGMTTPGKARGVPPIAQADPAARVSRASPQRMPPPAAAPAPLRDDLRAAEAYRRPASSTQRSEAPVAHTPATGRHATGLPIRGRQRFPDSQELVDLFNEARSLEELARLKALYRARSFTNDRTRDISQLSESDTDRFWLIEEPVDGETALLMPGAAAKKTWSKLRSVTEDHPFAYHFTLFQGDRLLLLKPARLKRSVSLGWELIGRGELSGTL